MVQLKIRLNINIDCEFYFIFLFLVVFKRVFRPKKIIHKVIIQGVAK